MVRSPRAACRAVRAAADAGTRGRSSPASRRRTRRCRRWRRSRVQFDGRNEPEPTTSIGALASAMTRHLAGPKPDEATILTLSKPARSSSCAQMEDRRRRHAGADEIAQLLLAAIAADRFGREALQHGVGRSPDRAPRCSGRRSCRGGTTACPWRRDRESAGRPRASPRSRGRSSRPARSSPRRGRSRGTSRRRAPSSRHSRSGRAAWCRAPGRGRRNARWRAWRCR